MFQLRRIRTSIQQVHERNQENILSQLRFQRQEISLVRPSDLHSGKSQFKKRESGLSIKSGVRNQINPNHKNRIERISAIMIAKDKGKRPKINIDILGTNIRGLLDSGASITVLGRDADKLIAKWKVKPKPIRILLKTADGKFHSCRKMAKLPIRFAGEKRYIRVFIAPNIDHDIVLGIDFWDAFGIRPAIFRGISSLEPEIICVGHDKLGREGQGKLYHQLTTEQEEALRNVKSHYTWSNDIDLGCTDLIVHHIDTGDNKPIKQKQYHTSPYVQEKINEEIDRLLDLKIIEPASAPQ